MQKEGFLCNLPVGTVYWFWRNNSPRVFTIKKQEISGVIAVNYQGVLSRQDGAKLVSYIDKS